MRVTPEEYQRMISKPKRSKYRNVRTAHGGVTYASKAEAAYAAKLDADMRAGLVRWYLRQVPLHLPGNTRYIVDFLVCERPAFGLVDAVHAIDVKGHATDVFRLKLRQARELYPHLPVRVVKRTRSGAFVDAEAT